MDIVNATNKSAFIMLPIPKNLSIRKRQIVVAKTRPLRLFKKIVDPVKKRDKNSKKKNKIIDPLAVGSIK